MSRLVNAVMDAITERIECEAGVVSALEWSVNEVMDNVLQHSMTDCGYVMVQVHSVTRHLAICVADPGRGIHASLRASQYRPSTDGYALTLAIQPGVTRDKRIGQGNGLWGLAEIVRANHGGLRIISGAAELHLQSTGVPDLTKAQFLDRKRAGTVVDFQLDTSEPIDLMRALGGYRPINLRLESLETSTGEHEIAVRSLAHGTGTRAAAQLLRTLVVNTLNEGSERVTLDFSGIDIVSSSFADELVGKLVTRLGFYLFNRRIGLKNLSPDAQGLLHRVVSQRMSSDLPST